MRQNGKKKSAITALMTWGRANWPRPNGSIIGNWGRGRSEAGMSCWGKPRYSRMLSSVWGGGEKSELWQRQSPQGSPVFWNCGGVQLAEVQLDWLRALHQKLLWLRDNLDKSYGQACRFHLFKFPTVLWWVSEPISTSTLAWRCPKAIFL